MQFFPPPFSPFEPSLLSASLPSSPTLSSLPPSSSSPPCMFYLLLPLPSPFPPLSPSPQADALKEKGSSRIKFVLKVQAPVILVPLSVSSKSALVLDLGLIKLNNTFRLARSLAGEGEDDAGFTSSAGHPALVDQMNISVSSIQLGRAMDVHEDYRTDLVNHMILKPLQFEGVLYRRLSPWCTLVPAIDVRTNLESIEVREYTLIMC